MHDKQPRSVPKFSFTRYFDKVALLVPNEDLRKDGERPKLYFGEHVMAGSGGDVAVGEGGVILLENLPDPYSIGPDGVRIQFTNIARRVGDGISLTHDKFPSYSFTIRPDELRILQRYQKRFC